jgi:Arc/MetJ family transcription regulator
MRRIQLDLDEDLWDALRAHARNQKATVSELVRVALRERYIRSHGQRMNAMQGFVGIRKRASEAPNAEEFATQPPARRSAGHASLRQRERHNVIPQLDPIHFATPARRDHHILAAAHARPVRHRRCDGRGRNPECAITHDPSRCRTLSDRRYWYGLKSRNRMAELNV